MLDISFTELLVIGVVALLVIGPERLPKVARTAGHLYGRMQRYVTTVRSDISREIQADELRKVGQTFRESFESATSTIEQEATAVDDYLKNEAQSVNRVLSAMGNTEGDRQVTADAVKTLSTEPLPDQRNLPLDEPDQNPKPVGRPVDQNLKPAEPVAEKTA